MAKQKIPGIFRKNSKEKKWNKKILKNVYIPTDKKWLSELFRLEEGKMIPA